MLLLLFKGCMILHLKTSLLMAHKTNALCPIPIFHVFLGKWVLFPPDPCPID